MALTEPTLIQAKPIQQLRNQEDEEEFIVAADAANKKGNADKARIRALLTPELKGWAKFKSRFKK